MKNLDTNISYSTVSISELKNVYGHELTEQEYCEMQKKNLETKSKVQYLKSTLREMKKNGEINSIQFRIFCEHHALNKDQIERSFSVIAKIVNLPVDMVLAEYCCVKKMLAENEKVKTTLGY